MVMDLLHTLLRANFVICVLRIFAVIQYTYKAGFRFPHYHIQTVIWKNPVENCSGRSLRFQKIHCIVCDVI